MANTRRLNRVESLYTRTRSIQQRRTKSPITKATTDHGYSLAWGNLGVQFAIIDLTGDITFYKSSGGTTYKGSAILTTHQNDVDARIGQLEANPASGDD